MQKKFTTVIVYPDGKKFTTFDNCVKLNGYREDCILFETEDDEGKRQHHAVLVGGGMVHIIRDTDATNTAEDMAKMLDEK